MANTTNFGWETPDDTDLVKDGAAAIRTLGSAIDTSLVDLKGGTTGQVLSKASNTDMDFTWANGGDITEVTAGTGISGGGTSGAVTITNSMATAIDAKGDLVAGTGADAFARLAVGANNTVLTADSSTSTGLKWATVSSGAVVQVKSATTTTAATTTGSTLLDTGLSISITPTSASNKILIFISQQMGAESTAAIPEPATLLALLRDSTTIWNGGGQYGFYFFKNAAGTTELRMIVSATYLDSPATTSSITYKTQYARGANNVTAKVQASGAESTITVMEVTP